MPSHNETSPIIYPDSDKPAKPDNTEEFIRIGLLYEKALEELEELSAERKRLEEKYKHTQKQHKHAETDSERIERLAAKLRALGIDPES